MNNYPNQLRQTLDESINRVAEHSWIYSTAPGHCFMRKRGKLDFVTTMKLIINMEGSTVGDEIAQFFNYSLDAPSESAFNQRRSLIQPLAFEHVFRKFVEAAPGKNTLDGYTILACDGSKVVYATDPSITEDFVLPRKPGDRGFNHMHVNALYDITNRIFVDALIQPGVNQDERQALLDMLEHYKPKDPKHVIITADRGYESYNTMAQIMNKGMYFVLRGKDYTSRTSLSSSYKEEFPDQDEFDVTIKRYITRSKRTIYNLNDTNAKIYKYLRPSKNFTLLEWSDKPNIFYLTFRIVRIKLGEGRYEIILTNLPRYDFPPAKLSEIYHMRWDIETAFRQLKYAVGMVKFHARKPQYIKQEIFAKLIVYNFSELIASHASKSKNDNNKNKHRYRINYSQAARLCHKFLKMSKPFTNLIELISRYLSIDKQTERSFPRIIRGIGAVHFAYRCA